jgi:hypothetical protein
MREIAARVARRNLANRALLLLPLAVVLANVFALCMASLAGAGPWGRDNWSADGDAALAAFVSPLWPLVSPRTLVALVAGVLGGGALLLTWLVFRRRVEVGAALSPRARAWFLRSLSVLSAGLVTTAVLTASVSEPWVTERALRRGGGFPLAHAVRWRLPSALHHVRSRLDDPEPSVRFLAGAFLTHAGDAEARRVLLEAGEELRGLVERDGAAALSKAVRGRLLDGWWVLPQPDYEPRTRPPSADEFAPDGSFWEWWDHVKPLIED